jgi:hypothetical protein
MTSYGELSVQRQEEIDAGIQKAHGGCVTYGEISQKRFYFLEVGKRIAALRTELSKISVELKNKEQILNATDFSKVDIFELERTVRSLLAARERLDAEAEAINNIVPVDYKHLCDLIQRFITIYGPVKLPKEDSTFIRGAGLAIKTVDEIYGTYEKMYDLICKLKGQAESFVSLWSGLEQEWDKVKDDLRKLSYMYKNQTVAARTITGARPWTGENAFGVKSFHFRPVDSEMPKGWVSGITSWALGTGESSHPSSSSSTT